MSALETDLRQAAPADRLLEGSWEARSRHSGARELAAEAAAGLLFLLSAVALLAVAGASGLEPARIALLVVLYAVVSRIEFPIGAGYVVPSWLLLAPMLVLLPAGIVPLVVAAGLVLGACGQWLIGQARPERMLFSVADGSHALGAAAVIAFAGGHLSPVALYFAAFAAAGIVDLVSATLREAAALGVAPQMQLRVVAQVWVADACLAPVGFLAAEAARRDPAQALVVIPLAFLLLLLARDRNARIAQAHHRLEQALTDPLTRLGNRRLLNLELREKLAEASHESPLVLIVIDLDGFKSYNDTFGHSAGDALLARLAARLGSAVDSYGTAYRLGGDEFCVLVEQIPERVEAPLSAVAQALTESGEEFAIRPSYGVALLPHETTDPKAALQLADRRMYATKHGRTSGPRDQIRDVLMRSIEARHPNLHDHSSDVADLSLRVGRRLGLSSEELDEMVRAAELHDVGKVGIPDTILLKPASLDATEWDLMYQHTILGERILNAAPPLRPVGSLVRSTHERWDGTGYPDRLRGDEIPLGARIIAVCDAYEAMVSDRPYRLARGHDDACLELKRTAGSQFDPGVVDAFLLEVDGLASQYVDPEPIDEAAAHLRELLAA